MIQQTILIHDLQPNSYIVHVRTFRGKIPKDNDVHLSLT